MFSATSSPIFCFFISAFRFLMYITLRPQIGTGQAKNQ
nr:MAG TPA: hypothetical protein [Caudoviricetes sp.]